MVRLRTRSGVAYRLRPTLGEQEDRETLLHFAEGSVTDSKEHGNAPVLDEGERKKADEEESLNAKATHEVIRREGEKELERSASGLAWSGLAAGLAMGFSLLAEGVLRSHLPDAPWRPLVAKLGYAVGFLIVILGSQQLYTENTLTPIVPLMTRRTGEMLRKVLVLWGVVLITNLIGASAFGWVAGTTDAFKPEVRDAFAAIGREALEAPFWTMFLRAIFAGWLIALMVWMLPAAQTAQVTVIIVMAWLVGAGSLSHIVVGTVEVMYLVATGAVSFGEYVTRFMIPALLGNTIGGVVLVALINHQQTAAGERKGK
jgi:formate/nitrite transporter FocA (FNT family)